MFIHLSLFNHFGGFTNDSILACWGKLTLHLYILH